MKCKVFVIVGLVLMLTGLVVYEEIMVNNSLNLIFEKSIKLQAFTADSEYINNSYVVTEADQIYDIWEDYEDKLSFVINHKNIQDMGIQITNLKAYITTNDIEDFRQTIALIVYYTDLFRHMAGVSLDSIF